jgi:hypothetical protein
VDQNVDRDSVAGKKKKEEVEKVVLVIDLNFAKMI